MLAMVKIMRPNQWLKNLMLFFPPFLGGVFFEPGVLIKGLLPFISFCLASSATYVINDIADKASDQHHPQKKYRPIAAGTLTTVHAWLFSLVLLVAALTLSASISMGLFAWLIAYLLLSLAYTFYLKALPIFDLFCIASGFVFRLFAGGEAFGVLVSDWLFLSVLLLALFLSAGKRLGEKKMLGQLSTEHRKTLSVYPEGVLNGFIVMTGATVLVTYTMYAITMQRLVYTVPLCCFGLFRYILLVNSGKSGDPTDSLVKDPVMFMVGLIWVIMVAVTIYH